MLPLNIYIVEDDSLMAATLKRMLINLGHSVCGIADNYKKAVYDLHKVKADLIISDIMINGNETGIDLGIYINKYLNTPFIYYSSVAESKTIQKAWNTMPGGYLTKPVTASTLKDAINNVVTTAYCSNLILLKTLNLSIPLTMTLSTNQLICRKCNKGILTRVRRPALVKFLLFGLPLKRYKCILCNKKSYVMDSWFFKPDTKETSVVK